MRLSRWWMWPRRVSVSFPGKMSLPFLVIHQYASCCDYHALGKRCIMQKLAGVYAGSSRRLGGPGSSNIRARTVICSAASFATQSALCFPLVIGISALWCPGEWIMANLYKNHNAASKSKISCLFLLVFPLAVRSPRSWSHGHCLWQRHSSCLYTHLASFLLPFLVPKSRLSVWLFEPMSQMGGLLPSRCPLVPAQPPHIPLAFTCKAAPIHIPGELSIWQGLVS